MESESPREIPRDTLDWLSAEKLLELIAHDINNLCHAAASYLDLAMDPSLPAESAARFLALAKSLVHRASRFTPHVRVLVDLRAANVAGTPTDPLARVADDAKARALALNPGVVLEVDRTGDAWDRRVAGGRFVALALGDLLDNAVRFARPGVPAKAVIEATLEGKSVRLTVRDNGKAFSPGQEAYATKRFSQVGNVSGAGIGLATLRVLAERTGGTLSVGNAKGGQGAVVTLRLPLAASS